MIPPCATTASGNDSLSGFVSLDSTINMTNHTFNIQRIVLRNIRKIATFGNQFKNLSGLFFDVDVFVIGRNLFNTFQSFSCCYIGQSSIRTVGRLRMDKIKACINSYANEKNSFSELRNSVLGKIIKMRLYNITGGNALKVLYDSINGFTTISSNQTFYILSNKRFRFFCINELCKMSE